MNTDCVKERNTNSSDAGLCGTIMLHVYLLLLWLCGVLNICIFLICDSILSCDH